MITRVVIVVVIDLMGRSLGLAWQSSDHTPASAKRRLQEKTRKFTDHFSSCSSFGEPARVRDVCVCGQQAMGRLLAIVDDSHDQICHVERFCASCPSFFAPVIRTFFVQGRIERSGEERAGSRRTEQKSKKEVACHNQSSLLEK